MAYLSGLKWQAELPQYSDDERKVLLTLSHDKSRWRTKERIAKTTGLPEDRVDSVLSGLMSQGKVRASISKKKNLIFGLRERVG
jgi:hypothetical protein